MMSGYLQREVPLILMKTVHFCCHYNVFKVEYPSLLCTFIYCLHSTVSSKAGCKISLYRAEIYFL